MKISVITPTFNSEKTIDRNIQSVISQTYKNFEQIIIDNLSRDRTIELAKSFYTGNSIIDKLKIMSGKDDGISDAFNKGINSASGEVIAILNSDDAYFNKNVFEKVIEILKDTEILFVHGDIYFVDPVYGTNIRKPLICPVTTAMPYNHPSMFIRKEVYRKFGLYDETYKYAMDYEFIIRLEYSFPGFKDKGKYYSGHPLAIMYSGGASWNNELKSIKESALALKKHGYWNSAARKNYTIRIFRTRMKKYLNLLHLNFFVRLWRNRKWQDGRNFF